MKSHVDAWLTDQYAALLRSRAGENFLASREVAQLLRCSYSEAKGRMLDGRIRTIKDGRWLRTRREWVEQYVAAKTIKPPDPEVIELPRPRGRRHVYVGIKLKSGGMDYQFLKERVAAGGGAEVGHVALSVAKYGFGRASTLVQDRQRWCEIRV